MSAGGAARTVRLPRTLLEDAGAIAMVELGGHRVGVMRSPAGVHALADRCPHRGAPLCSHGELVTTIEAREGAVVLGPRLGHVRCPWHKWDFELASGRCAAAPRMRVRAYHAWEDGHEIVVSIDPPAEPQ